MKTEQAVCDICQEDHSIPMARGWDFEYETTKMEFQYVLCKNCHLIYLKNRPDISAMSQIYPAHYYSFNESETENKWIKKIRDRLETRKIESYHRLLADGPRHVLDIGCGDGRLLDIIKRHGPAMWKLYGIEIGESGAKNANAKGYEIICGDIECLDVSRWKGQFDLVLMHHVLEHTRSPFQVIQKVKKLLKKGGVYSIETPDTGSWDRKIFEKRYWGGYHIPRHFHLFNKENLSKLLEREGYDIISRRNILSPVFWIQSIHHFLLEKKWGRRLAAFFNYQNAFCLACATLVELLQVYGFHQSSNMQILARKKNLS